MSAEVRIVLDAPAETMGLELLKAIVDELKIAGASWQELSQDQQDGVIARISARIRHETARAVNLIAGAANDSARVKVESVTVKDGSKIVLKTLLPVHDVIDHVGKDAVLVMVDPEQFFGGMDSVKGDKDQPDLPLANDGE